MTIPSLDDNLRTKVFMKCLQLAERFVLVMNALMGSVVLNSISFMIENLYRSVVFVRLFNDLLEYSFASQ